MARRLLDVAVTRTTGATVRVAVDDADPRFAALFDPLLNPPDGSTDSADWNRFSAANAAAVIAGRAVVSAVAATVADVVARLEWTDSMPAVVADSWDYSDYSTDQTADIDLTAPTEPTR